jgi:hypothetical protein
VRLAAGMAWVLVLVLACGPRAADEAEAEGTVAVETGLVVSMDIRMRGDTADFGLHIGNATVESIVLEFATAQRYDFAVLTLDGEELWRWSADQLFAQFLGEELLEPGETIEYRATWAARAAPGRYVAEGRLVATNRPLELRMEFEIPAQ